ncbi:hypothetical protein OH492_17475 [Vibrio chagasii]|nr:hypothetical protein [Vibrio chagasii]
MRAIGTRFRTNEPSHKWLRAKIKAAAKEVSAEGCRLAEVVIDPPVTLITSGEYKPLTPLSLEGQPILMLVMFIRIANKI